MISMEVQEVHTSILAILLDNMLLFLNFGLQTGGRQVIGCLKVAHGCVLKFLSHYYSIQSMIYQKHSSFGLFSVLAIFHGMILQNNCMANLWQYTSSIRLQHWSEIS